MCRRMIKWFLATLLLLAGGCSSTPVDISGSVDLKSLTSSFYDLTDRQRIEFIVYFCSKEVKIEERSTAKYLPIVQSKIQEIAKKECLTASTDIKSLTYSANNILPGKYTTCAILITRNEKDWGLERLLWIKNINISKSQQLESLNIDNAYFY